MEDESSPIAIETDCYYGVITSHYNGLPSSITTVFTKSEVLLIRNGYQAITKWKHKWKREKSNSDKLPLFHCRKTPREDSLSKAIYLRNKVIYMELISWEQLLFLCLCFCIYWTRAINQLQEFTNRWMYTFRICTGTILWKTYMLREYFQAKKQKKKYIMQIFIRSITKAF